MCPPLAGSDYYGGSATPRPSQRTTRLLTAGPAGRKVRSGRDASHVHRVPVVGLGAQLCPCGLATSTPQPFLVASPPSTSPGKGVAHPAGRAPHPGPYPPDLSRCHLLRGVTTLVPHVHLPVSLAGPGPSGSASPSRRCQGCSHPPRRLPAQAALSFTALLRQAGDEGLPPPSGQTRRLVAHEVPDPSPGPDRTDPADATGTAGEGQPRLPTPRHHDAVRRAWKSPAAR